MATATHAMQLFIHMFIKNAHCITLDPDCMHNCYWWTKHERARADIPTAVCFRVAAPNQAAAAVLLRALSFATAAAGMLLLDAIFCDRPDAILPFSDDPCFVVVPDATIPVCAPVPPPACALGVSTIKANRHSFPFHLSLMLQHGCMTFCPGMTC